MAKCKRCHAPDELNGIGLCKHCAAFIKNDVRANKERLEAIYNCFPEGLQTLDDSQKSGYLSETEEIFRALDQYNRIGFPVGSYVMPVRKILHFLDEGGKLEKSLLAGRRRRSLITAGFCAPLVAAFTVVLVVLGNNPLTGGGLGEAVAVSGEAGEEGQDFGGDAMGPGMDGGAEMPDGMPVEANGAAGMESAELSEGTDEGAPPEGQDGAGDADEGAARADGGETTDPAESAGEDTGGEVADPAEGAGEDTGGEEAESAADDGGTDNTAAPAPRRVSGGGGAVSFSIGSAGAVRIG